MEVNRRGEVVRYEAANVRALNFVLRGALGGGGPRTLRSDNLGKSLGGALVRLEIEVPDAVAADLARRPKPDVAWADAMIRARTGRPSGGASAPPDTLGRRGRR